MFCHFQLDYPVSLADFENALSGQAVNFPSVRVAEITSVVEKHGVAREIIYCR